MRRYVPRHFTLSLLGSALWCSAASAQAASRDGPIIPDPGAPRVLITARGSPNFRLGRAAEDVLRPALQRAWGPSVRVITREAINGTIQSGDGICTPPAPWTLGCALDMMKIMRADGAADLSANETPEGFVLRARILLARSAAADTSIIEVRHPSLENAVSAMAMRLSAEPTLRRPPFVEDDAVHRAVLEYWASKSPHVDTLYVASTEHAPFKSVAAAEAWAGSGRRPIMRRVPSALLRAYARANTYPVRIRVPPSVDGRPVVLTSLPSGAAQESLRYVLAISRPGFSAAGDSAAVVVSHTCGPLCGTRAMLLAKRERGRWRISGELWAVIH